MKLPRPSWRRPSRRRPSWRPFAAVVTGLALTTTGLAAGPAQAADIVTPGNFTGYGFDQCTAPSQQAMDAWLNSSPFWAVGIYISGASRGCLSQPNLTPTWVDTQLRNGWRLLPITLGPQASCTTRERYLRQERINPDPLNKYAKARAQGRREATTAVGEATRLGIVPGSTLWYDIEAFDTRPTHCRESALSFLHAWTNKVHKLGYVSGVYSSAASGIKMLDDVRALRPGAYRLPDQIWIADWNGRADLHSSYIRRDGWMPHARVHQYRGDHVETHGGVSIPIDSNYMSLGRGSVAPAKRLHCDDVDLDLPAFRLVKPGTARANQVRALQCRLREKRIPNVAITGVHDPASVKGVKAWEASRGLLVNGVMSRSNWMMLLTDGKRPVLKLGSTGGAVLRVQRALNAALDLRVPVTGRFDSATTTAVRTYQSQVGLRATGVVAPDTWAKLKGGAR